MRKGIHFCDKGKILVFDDGSTFKNKVLIDFQRISRLEEDLRSHSFWKSNFLRGFRFDDVGFERFFNRYRKRVF